MTALQLERQLNQMRVDFVKNNYPEFANLSEQDLLSIYTMLVIKEKNVDK